MRKLSSERFNNFLKDAQLAAVCSFLRDTKLVSIRVYQTPGFDLFTMLYCFSVCLFTWHTLILGETWKYKLKSFSFINSPSRYKGLFLFQHECGPLSISGIFGFCSAFGTPLNTEKSNKTKAEKGEHQAFLVSLWLLHGLGAKQRRALLS